MGERTLAGIATTVMLLLFALAMLLFIHGVPGLLALIFFQASSLILVLWVGIYDIRKNSQD